MWGMGKKEVVTITDDIDGRAGAETVTFAYAGRSYEIDLGEKNTPVARQVCGDYYGKPPAARGSIFGRRGQKPSDWIVRPG
jgi:hypothetical protein